MKTEVYSWRLSSDLKSDLEREARARKTSLSHLLEMAARDWLKKSNSDNGEDETQKKLHAAAERCFGSLTGRLPPSESVRVEVRARLRRKYGR
jgi:hypothetical protein